MINNLHGQFDRAQMLVHGQRGRFAGRADRNDTIDAGGNLLFEQMDIGPFRPQCCPEKV